MKIPASTDEWHALTRLVFTSAKLLVEMGRAISDHGRDDSHLNVASVEFVDAIVKSEQS